MTRNAFPGTGRPGALGVTAVLALSVIACGGQEQQVVDNYFRAIQTRDAQTVAGFSTVQFEGSVKSWKVESVGEEQRAPAPIADLDKKMKDAAEAEAQNKKEYNAYFNANPVEVDRVMKLPQGAPVPAALAKYATEWRQYEEKNKTLKTAAAEAKAAFEREKRLVTMSTGQQQDVEKLSGDLVTKDVVVQVETDGDMKPYKLTLRKYELTAGGTGPKPMSRWLITGLRAQ
jgi:hypothetical protein